MAVSLSLSPPPSTGNDIPVTRLKELNYTVWLNHLVLSTQKRIATKITTLVAVSISQSEREHSDSGLQKQCVERCFWSGAQVETHSPEVPSQCDVLYIVLLHGRF